MTDADWNKEFDHKSVSGTCMRICTRLEIEHGLQTGDWPDHNFLNWRSKKQADQVADSTESSETAAACLGVRDLMWQRNVLDELGILANNSRGILLLDNSTLVVNLNNGKITTNTRHYGRNVSFLIHEIESLKLTVCWIPAKQNWANQLTKSLPPGQTTAEASHLMGNANWPPL
jgi:hypothetical protein